MADTGFIALILALAVSTLSVVAFVVGAGKGYPRLMAIARKGVLVIFGLVLLAAYALYYALLTHDFQLEYVVSHTSRDMPLIYNISAFWAGNAGSLLFLSLFLSLVTIVVIFRKREADGKLLAYTSAVIISTLTFLLLLIILTANPFEKISHAPSDGMGLNPILENPGMIIHPPLLLAGYITFTVPFALAIAALITKCRESDWLSSARTWTLLAWLLLGAGNLIGAWWAYVELGWGGYWAWDPVENAGLMPWLVATAFLHSMTIQRRTGMLKIWTMALITLTFNLCIFGMFLNRSDFLSSVHSYTDTGMEAMFLTFLSITLLTSLGLILSRHRYLRSEKREGPLVSKENFFVLTNILFIAATFIILLGTLFPWLSEKISGSITTVQASFFDKTVGPVFLLIILLAGICILLSWRRISFLNLVRKAIYPLVISLALCLVLYLIGIQEWYALVLFPLCSFVLLTHLTNLFREVRARCLTKKENPLKALVGLFWANRPHYGGMIIHLGIVLIAIGIIGSSFYQSETEAALLPGDSMTIENYTLTYEEMTVSEASNKLTFTTTLSVYDGDSPLGMLKPERYIQRGSSSMGSEVAIRTMPHWWIPLEDLYVILAGWTEDGATIFKVLVNPLVDLIWIGGGVLILGGMFAFWPGRNKRGNSFKDRYKKEDVVAEIETSTMADTKPSLTPVSTNDIPLEETLGEDRID